ASSWTTSPGWARAIALSIVRHALAGAGQLVVPDAKRTQAEPESLPVVERNTFAEGFDPPDEQAAVDADTDERAERFPAASNASTASEYELPHANPVTVYVVDGVEPTGAP